MDMLHLLASKGPNYENPWKETRNRAKKKTGRQHAERGSVQITLSIEAINNNWGRVERRLMKEIPQVEKVWTPVPAYDGWTVKLDFDCLADLEADLTKVQLKVEKICCGYEYKEEK